MPRFLISGILAALFALVLELIVSSASDFARTNIVLDTVPPGIPFLALLALIEEAMKFSVLWKVARAENTPAVFPSGAILFTLGFGGTEVFLAGALFPAAPISALVGIFAVHAGTILLYGYGVRKRFSLLILATMLIAGIILHALYNVLLI